VGLVPAAIFDLEGKVALGHGGDVATGYLFNNTTLFFKAWAYPAVVLGDAWLQEVAGLDHLPRPGLKAQSPGRRLQGGSRRPHGGVEAVDGDVLHGLGAQQVDEVHLDATHSRLQLYKARRCLCDSDYPNLN